MEVCPPLCVAARGTPLAAIALCSHRYDYVSKFRCLLPQILARLQRDSTNHTPNAPLNVCAKRSLRWLIPPYRLHIARSLTLFCAAVARHVLLLRFCLFAKVTQSST